MANRSRRGLHLGDDAARRGAVADRPENQQGQADPAPVPPIGVTANEGDIWYAGHATLVVEADGAVGEQVPTLPTAYRIRPEEKPSLPTNATDHTLPHAM